MKNGTAIIVLLLGLLACSEQRHLYFSTGVEAKSSEAGKHGWIPEWLPAGAREVHVQYDIDTNYIWVRCQMSPNEREALLGGFVEIPWDKVKDVELRKPRRAAWWFEGLIQQQPSNDTALNATVYRGNGAQIPSGVFIAVSRSKPETFVWITG